MSAKNKFRLNWKLSTLSLTLIAVIGFMSLLLNLSYKFIPTDNLKTANAATEPSCQTAASTPTWNPYPINTIFPNPIITSGDCKDMPLLSFFPVDTRSGNLREKSILRSQNFSIQLYYNNGATPGSNAISNPTVKTQFTKVSDTRYKISAELSGSNVSTVNSSQKGGDLFITVPAGAKFDIVANSTDHFPDAIERKEETDATGKRPNDTINDNTTGSNVSNAIYSAFEGKTLASTNGFVVKSGGLEAGFLGYGYILTQIAVQIGVQPIANDPPAIPGEEITIIRGESGKFKPLAPTDPNSDYPITLDLNKVNNGCSVTGTADNKGGNQVIVCQTTATTPARFSFVLTPTDSRGLVGTPGTFIVNVVDPNLEPTKKCFVKGTSTECRAAPLNAGDQITYKIGVKNISTVRANNLKVVDVYDGQKITDISNISNSGISTTANSTVTWANLGTLPAGQTIEVSFDAKVATGVKLGDIVINSAKVSADFVPEKEVKADFTIGGALDLVKRCFVRDATTACSDGNLVAGSKITYEVEVTNSTKSGVKNVVLKDTYEGTKLTDIGNFQPAADLNAQSSLITWKLGDMATGTSKKVRFDATIASSVTPATIIKNIAVVSADGLPDKQAINEFPTIGPKLTAEKLCFKQGTTSACSSSNLKPGENITYVIRVANVGTAVVENLTINDTYDTTKITSITNINPQGTLDAAKGTIAWSLGKLDVAKTTEVKFDATVRTDIPSGTTVVNTAVVKATNIPDIIVKAVFDVVFIIPAVVTPRTGGEMGIIFIIFAISLAGAVYYYYKRNNKFAGNFVPERNVENGAKKSFNLFDIFTKFGSSEGVQKNAKPGHRIAPKKKM